MWFAITIAGLMMLAFVLGIAVGWLIYHITTY